MEPRVNRGTIVDGARGAPTSSRILGSGAAGLLTAPDGRYLLQLRDDRPDIWFPGHWGLFGGAVESHEAPHDALRRELAEELGLAVCSATYFCQVIFDLGDPEAGFRRRYFYAVPIDAPAIAGLRLGEGQAMRWFAYAELFGTDPRHRIVPYDAFGIMLHASRVLLESSRHLP